MPQVLLVEDDVPGESSNGSSTSGSSTGGSSPSGSSPAEKALESAGEFDLRRAHRAEEVLEEKYTLRPSSGGERPGVDLLVTAHFLPQLNGPGLTEKLREAGVDLPILFITGRQGPATRASALHSGADDCVSRPVPREELTARLRALLRRPRRWEPVTEIHVGPLVVDASRQEARTYGNRLGLRQKEFNLLYCLADRHPAPAGRDQIATRVWEKEKDVVSDNSIDVTMSGLRERLRGALPEGEAYVQIETVRKVGYRLRLGPEE